MSVLGNPLYIQGEAHEVLQSDSTQSIDHVQKCLRQNLIYQLG